MKRFLSVLSAVAHFLIAVIVITYFIAITFRLSPSGKIVVTGRDNFRYFTVLSNLFQALASLILALNAVLGRKKGRGLEALQWSAATSVGLTFVTVLLFLGPPVRYRGMYDGANLWFHMLIPVAAMILFVLSRDDGALPLSRIGWCMAPMTAYGIWYGANIAVNGFYSRGWSNDFYGFLRGSWKNAPLSAAVMLACVSGLAVALWLLRRSVNRLRARRPR